jgi:cytochrome P450
MARNCGRAGFRLPRLTQGFIERLPVENAGSRMYAYGSQLIARKRVEPADDMLSVVASATLDYPEAPGLTDVELYLFFDLFFSASAQTTRNAIAGRPARAGRTARAVASFAGGSRHVAEAIEEMVGWTSPSKRRTATREAQLGAQVIDAGQLVSEGWANRDALVFDVPDVFDITRKPNPHLGFGPDVHCCLGANLACLELRVLFEELLNRFGSVRVVKPVECTRSNRHTGIRHLVVELGS